MELLIAIHERLGDCRSVSLFSKTMKTKLSVLLSLGLGVMFSLWPVVAQQTTAFTYQGQLQDDGANANGTYSMIFKLYSALTSGSQIGSAITNSPTLANGLFSVNLDFGAGAFDGNARWLDITVIHDGTTQTLAPRGQVLPAPYSLFASTSGSVTTGPWTVQSGNFGIPDGTPNGGSTNNNVLKFSANGIDWMGISPMGGGLIARSQFTVGGPIYADNLRLNPGGTVYSDYAGGLYFNKGPTQVHVAVNGDISTAGRLCGNLCNNSDRELKERFAPIDPRDILERVVSLPISIWNFKQDKEARHIGPMAQDFYAAFDFGSDDKHIATVDEGGVALAAIQGLNEKLKEKDARIESLEKRLADLERWVKSSAHHETGDR